MPERPLQAPAALPGPVVLILGIMHRSGTNYLLELLARHPRFVRHAVPEDFLVSRLAELDRYVASVVRQWNPRWRDAVREADLRRDLGDGLVRFLWSHLEGGGSPRNRATHVLAKTPSVIGLERVSAYLPEARLLVLVRDGRAVVESGRRSFGWDFDEAAHTWAQRVRLIRSRIASAATPDPTLRVVRYEDVLADPAGEVGCLLDWLGLPQAEYPFDMLAQVPVLGSSDLAAAGGELHWKPTAAGTDFSPASRFASWSLALHARFEVHAARELEWLGYPFVGQHPPSWPVRAWIVLRTRARQVSRGAWRRLDRRARRLTRNV